MVVGDQASYLGAHVSTAHLLGKIASEVGFSVEEIFVWRKRRPSTKSKMIEEHALILQRTKR